MGFEPTTYSMGSKSSANDFQPLRPPRQVHELAVALLTKIEADEEVSDLEVRQLAAAVLEAEPVRLAMQVLAAQRPIMRAIEFARAVLKGTVAEVANGVEEQPSQ
jgi:hypothetical protein